MTGRRVHVVLVALLVVALGAQTLRLRDRLEASRLLRQVESRTTEALARRRAPSTMFNEHFLWLDRARRLAPAEVGVPIARGSQFLLLRRPVDALAAYEEAAALELRPEIELNRGRAYWMQGDTARASEAFARAVRLNPLLIDELPPDAPRPSRP